MRFITANVAEDHDGSKTTQRGHDVAVNGSENDVHEVMRQISY